MRIWQKAKKYSVHILVILLIVLVQCSFVVQKEGYHMDELLSFELANAEYNPWIVPTQPVGRLAKFMHEEIDGETLGETLRNMKDTVVDVLQNRGSSKLLSYKADVYEEPVWITGEQFQEYITTGPGDRFNYLSVYFNVKDDNHPPIHFMLLHTISSLFPGKLVPIMGCVINIAALVGCAVILMKLGMLLDECSVFLNKQGEMRKQMPVSDQSGSVSDHWGIGTICGLVAALLYGCSQAAVATTLLIRMYGVLTFLCLAFFYIHIKKWLKIEFNKKNMGLIAVTVLGFLTQYFFLFYCLVLAAATAMCLFIYRRRKELLIYIRSMVIAAVIGVGVFPFSIGDVFASSRGVEALDKLNSGFGDFIERIGVFGEILLNRCFGNVWIGLLLLTASLVLGVILFWKRKEQRPLLVFAYVPVLGYFLLAAKLSPMYVDRYLMAGFPFVISWLAMLISFVWRRMPYSKVVQSEKTNLTREQAGDTNLAQVQAGDTNLAWEQAIRAWAGRGIAAALIVVYCCLQVFTYDGTYLYVGYEEQKALAEEYGNLHCICLYEGSGYYDNLLEFAEYEKTLLVTPVELLERKNTSDIFALQEVVFVVKNIIPEKALEAVLEKYGFEISKVLVENGACGDDVYLCRRIG